MQPDRPTRARFPEPGADAVSVRVPKHVHDWFVGRWPDATATEIEHRIGQYLEINLNRDKDGPRARRRGQWERRQDGERG